MNEQITLADIQAARTRIAAYIQSLRIIGVSMQRGAAMAASQAAGTPVEVEELPTLADSPGGGIGLDNPALTAAPGRHPIHHLREARKCQKMPS